MGSDMIIAGSSGGSGAFNLLLLLAVPLVFYFLLIRPQSKRRKEQANMQNAMEPGARVLTTSGIHATVVAIDDDGLLLEIAPGVEVRFVRQAIMQVLRDEEPDEAADDLDDEAGEPGADAEDDAGTGRVELTKGDAEGAGTVRTSGATAADAEGAGDEGDAPGSAPRTKVRAEAAEKPSA